MFVPPARSSPTTNVRALSPARTSSCVTGTYWKFVIAAIDCGIPARPPACATFALCDGIIGHRTSLPLATSCIRAGASAGKRATEQRADTEQRAGPRRAERQMRCLQGGDAAGDNFGRPSRRLYK